MLPLPYEFAIGGVFLPPLLIAAIFGLVATVLTQRMMERHRVTRYFFYPPVVSLSLVVIYTVFIGTFLIGI